MKYGLKEETIHAINNIFKNHKDISEVLLYGSRAKGNFKPGSDIDLTIKGTDLDLTIQNKISNELDDLLLPYTFDLSIFNQISNKDLIEHIERVGILFYKK